MDGVQVGDKGGVRPIVLCVVSVAMVETEGMHKLLAWMWILRYIPVRPWEWEWDGCLGGTG